MESGLSRVRRIDDYSRDRKFELNESKFGPTLSIKLSPKERPSDRTMG